MKQLIVGIAFLGIIGSLASALFFMMRGEKPGETDDTKRAGLPPSRRRCPAVEAVIIFLGRTS